MLSYKPGDVVVVRGRAYQLKELMGRGGQGSVFSARDAAGLEVAVKFVPAHPRHRAEVKILASFQSPHVVRLLDAGAAKDTLILVMERVNGIDLKALIRLCREQGRRIPPRVAIDLILQATIGLEHAYERAHLRVHRDIKPGNLILDGTGTLKLIDFGIARREGMEFTGSLVGTPENMAPEQLGLNDWKVDLRTDLYCLGLVLYEMLTLETLHQFPKSMPVPQRLMEVWESRVGPRIRRIDAIHPSLGAFLRRTLQRDPSQRFQTPVEMREALHRVRRRLPSAADLPSFAASLYEAMNHPDASSAIDTILPRSEGVAATLALPERQKVPSCPTTPMRDPGTRWRAARQAALVGLGGLLILSLFLLGTSLMNGSMKSEVSRSDSRMSAGLPLQAAHLKTHTAFHTMPCPFESPIASRDRALTLR